jgi:hypothetical protein
MPEDLPMTPSNSSPPWYAPWRSAADPVATEDPADLGTAYGLDLSLDPLPRPSDDARAPAHDGRWVQHPHMRRKPAV